MRKAIGDKKRMVFYGPGNNASVILSGADYKTAIKKTLDAAFILNGQAAVCVNRCIIDNRIDKDEIRQLFEEALSEIKFGTDALNAENYVTPIKINQLVELTDSMVNEGLCSETSLINYKLQKYGDAVLMHPALVWNCACDSKLFKNYHFSPVLPICFSDVDSISHIVNGTDFGIYTNYWGNANDVALLKAKTESKHILTLENESILDVISPEKGYDGPWGGYKNSGFILNENTSWEPVQGGFQLIKILLQK
jgi:acyl-CoA reductase-like NAD-dependent aldehyde dehydrogenase